MIASNSLHAETTTYWDQVRMEGLAPGAYRISSGTGFFVTSQYLITNAHVVENCLTISIRGAVLPARATLMAVDLTHDLALLATNRLASRVATLRNNTDVQKGEGVFVIGYPLTQAETGNYVLTTATITDFDPPFDTAEHIFMTQSVEEGNSGGPLIDRGGNVIGVIVAKRLAKEWMVDVATNQTSNYQETINGVAIGLGALKHFLETHHIPYQSHSTYDLFTEYRPDRRAKEYIVNIHCVQNSAL